MKYRIFDFKTNEILIKSIELPSDRVENLSSDTDEGMFIANQLEELESFGEKTVYAILL